MEDHLSNLPKELIFSILSLNFSYKEVVRCSKLSRRWRDLYKESPELHFTDSDILNSTQMDLPQEERYKLISHIVSKALFRHKASVDTLSIQVKDGLQLWHWCLDYIANYPIKHLTLWSTHEISHLQEFPFRPENLLYLDLWNVEVQPLHRLFFPKLKECRMDFGYDDKFRSINDFLQRCSCLEFLDIKAPITSANSPYTIRSDSLKTLVLHPLCSPDDHSHSEVEIRLQTPKLLRVYMEGDEADLDFRIRLEAPELRNIFMNSTFHAIECHEGIKKGGVFFSNAKWNPKCEMTDLDMISPIKDGLLTFENLDRLGTLKRLNLSYFRIYTIELWEWLCELPSLESLTFFECSFEDDNFEFLKDEDAYFDVSNMNGNGSLVYTRKPYEPSALSEVSFNIKKLSPRDGFLSRGEREMIQLVWEKAKHLKKLNVATDLTEQFTVAKYLQFFGHIVSPGDRVHFTEDGNLTMIKLEKQSNAAAELLGSA